MILTGKIVYPRLFRPDRFDEKSEPKFSCTVLVDKKDPVAVQLVNDVNRLIETKLNGQMPEDRYMPIKDGDKSGNPDFAGCWEVRCKSKEDQPPGVVDGNLEKIFDQDAIRGGDNVRVQVKVYAYNQRYRGIGIQLDNVQFISKGEKVIGNSKARPEDAFTAIPGSESPVTRDVPPTNPAGFLG